MEKIINIAAWAILAVMGMAFSSCGDDKQLTGISPDATVPSGIELMETGNNSIVISWDHVPDAVTYTVQLLADPDSNMPSHQATVTTDFHEFGGLTQKSRWSVRVRANYPYSVYSEWNYLIDGDGRTAVVKVGTGLIDPDFVEEYVKLLRATSSTIAVEWSFNEFDFPAEDAETLVKVELYSSESPSAQNMVVGWTLEYSNVDNGNLFAISSTATNRPARFIFTGLESSTDYWVRVKNLSEKLDDPVLTGNDGYTPMYKMSTTPPVNTFSNSVAVKEGDVLVFQDFSRLLWGGDISTNSAGYSSTDRSSFTSVEQGRAAGDEPDLFQTHFTPVRCTNEIGLFNTLKGIVASAGLGDWGMTSSSSSQLGVICSRPGYIKLGASSHRGGIVTSEMSLLTGRATVKLTFSACMYREASVSDPRDAVIKVHDGAVIGSNWLLSGGEERIVDEFEIEGDGSEWIQYSYTIKDILPSSRISIGGNAPNAGSRQNRFLLDDIVIELVEYTD